MAIFNCKSCGGDLEIQEGATVVTCEYCGRQQTVPSMDNEKKVNLFNRANRLRSKCDFDKAASVYESIVAEFPQESEAYWGLCLCKFGIEYVDDPGTAKKIPTCHRTSYESIFDDQNFDMACENADALAVNQLRGEAKEIDRLQKEILEIAKNEQPFDVFICYKESDEMGGRTVDSELAHDIYDVLTEKGYKVFYSRITLKSKLGQDYEPYIFSALNSAKVMLSIGTKYEYFNAVWVKNEWSRFLSLMKSDKSKMLIPCYRDIDPYDMPREFSALQGQDLSSPRAFQDLVTNIERIIPKATIQSNSASASSSTDPLLKRAFLCLEDGDWDGVDKCCEKILDIDPENARAYFVKLCSELKVNKPKDIVNNEQPLDDNSNFKKALRFADEAYKKELESYNNAILDRIDIERKNVIYNDAVQKMNSALTPSDFKAVKEIFLTISGFKDADKLAEECDNADTLKTAWIYEEGLKKMDSAKSVREYLEARELFRSISMFKNSKELAENCNEQIYCIAIELMKESGSESKASKIVKMLRNISEYEDAEELAELIEDGALEYYKKAKIAVRNNDFRRAEQFLSSISGFFEADDLAKCCKNIIQQNGSKDSEDYRKLQSFSQISGGFERSAVKSKKPKDTKIPSRKPNSPEAPITSEKNKSTESSESGIYDKAIAFFQEGDYEASENWFKKIPGYKDVDERLNLIEHINLFSDSCKNIKGKYEQDLSESFRSLTETEENNRISRAVLMSCCLWSVYFLIFLICIFLLLFNRNFFFRESFYNITFSIIPILFIPWILASIIFTKKVGASKRAALPIIFLAIAAGFGVVINPYHCAISLLCFIPFAVFAAIAIIYRQKSKKHENSIQACREIKNNLNLDIEKLKQESNSIPDFDKKTVLNKIFGDDPWNALTKPVGYTNECLNYKKSSKLFVRTLALLAINVVLIIIVLIVDSSERSKQYNFNLDNEPHLSNLYEESSDRNSKPAYSNIASEISEESSSDYSTHTAAEMAEAALVYNPDCWSMGMTLVDDETLAVILPGISSDMFDDYCFYCDMMGINGHTVFVGKPKSGRENTVQYALERSFDAYKGQAGFYPAGEGSVAGAVSGITDSGYYYCIIHADGANIASAMLKGSLASSTSPISAVDYTDVDNVFNSCIGDLLDSATDTDTSFMGYYIDYKGKNGTFYISITTDIHDPSHVNDFPNSIYFPIKMLIPGKSSYTIDELKSIFGDQLLVEYMPDSIDGSGYYVGLDGKYNIQFSNGSGTSWTNYEITTPFTSCFINRYN